MKARRTMLRGAALVAAGSLGVHELRFFVGYGDESEQALAAQGHAYMSLLGPLVAAALAVACGMFIASLAGGQRAHSRGPAHAGRIWVLASSALTAIYVLQETVEGMLATGHPAGVAGVLADGGWTALLFAAAIGAAIALVLSGLRAAADATHELVRPILRGPLIAPAPHVTTKAPAGPRGPVLARHLAGRAPPATS